MPSFFDFQRFVDEQNAEWARTHPAISPGLPAPVVQTPPSAVDPVVTGINLEALTQQLYGKPIPVSLGGRRRMGGYIVWGPRQRYHPTTGQTLWSFAVSFGLSADPDGRRDVLEIRLDSTVVYSSIDNVVTPWLIWRFYPGSETQEPDPLAVEAQGSAATAFRGQMVIFFEDVPSPTIPFVGALIADAVTGGLSAHVFETPTATAIRSIFAIDWAGQIAYSHGSSTGYRLLAHRADRTQIFDVPITNLSTTFVGFDEIGFLWCPEAQVIFGAANDGFATKLAALDPDAAAIVAEGPGAWNVFGGLTYYADTSTAATVIVVASVDIFVANSIHIDFYTPATPQFTYHYVSSSNLDGLGGGGNVTAVIRVPDGGRVARFLVAQGPTLVLATVDVRNQSVALSVVYSASAVINNLDGDPIDGGVVVFLADGTALKLQMGTYGVLWSVSPGFTVPTPGATGNAFSSMEGWRKTQQTFAIYAGGGIYYLSLVNGSVTFKTDLTGTEPGGHIMFDAATNTLIISDNGDPRAYYDEASSNDTIPKATALTKLAEFWGYVIPDEFEVIGVPGVWIAVIVAYDTSFQDLLGLFKSIEPWDVIQTDKLRVVQRDLGASLVLDGTLSADDIKDAGNGQPALVTTQAEEVELPAITELQFIDPARDYNWNLARYRQPREPVAVTSSLSTEQIKLPVVIDMDDAKLLVASKSYRDRAARENHAFAGMPSTYQYEPGDVIAVDTGLVSLTAAKILTADAGSDWSMQFTVESLLATGPIHDSAFWVAGVLPTDSGGQPTPTPMQTDGSEAVVYLDGPVLGPSQDGGGTSLLSYFAITTRAVAPYTLRYAVFSRNTNLLATGGNPLYYFPLTQVPIYGALTAALGDTATPFLTDYVNTLTFRPVCGDSSLIQAVTYTELMNKAQVFAVGRPGHWEIIGAGETVTTNADGTLTLTGLLRGRRGSEVFCGDHAVGDQVLCLAAKGSTSIAASAALGYFGLPAAAATIASLLGASLYRASGIPHPLPQFILGAIQAAPISGNAEKPYAPVHLAAVIAGSDIEIDWDRRDRLDWSHGGGAAAPMSEDAELYDIVIMDGVSVRRTYTDRAPPPFTYPAADITADWGSLPADLEFEVYQKSALVGRGFAGQATIAVGGGGGGGGSGTIIATLIADNVAGRNNTIVDGTETDAGSSAGEFDYWVLDSGSPYWIYQDGWGVGGGGNYTLTLRAKDTFPNDTDIDWIYSTSGSPVLSFQSVGWRGGTYGPAGINNMSALDSVRLDHITQLQFTFEFSSRGTQSLFGTGIDFAVTIIDDYQTGQTSDQAFEILVALRYPGGPGTADFSYTAAVSGIGWSVILQDVGSAPIEVVVWPTGDNWQTSGTFDILELFNQLAAHAVVSHGNTFTMAGLYFGGFNFGCEPQGGSGGITINNFSVDYADDLGIGNNWSG